jgi:general secretion pathway protein I
MTSGRGHGFTLVEVLVALAIVALSLPALLFALDQQVDGTAYLRDKSLARVVAANKIEELRLLAAARGRLLQGSESGEARLADRDWYWWIDSSATDLPSFSRVAVSVGLEPEEEAATLVTVVAYLSDPGGGSGEPDE